MFLTLFAVRAYNIKNTISLAAELEIKTVTIHTARTRFTAANTPDGIEYPAPDLPGARERILRQIYEILPFAEQHRVCIAVENLFLPSGTAKFITSIITSYNSPYLGFCYDSGHALLMESLPGKNFADIPEWIRIGWENNTVTPQECQLDLMLDHVVTCHLHDNNALSDQHLLPGSGVATGRRSSAS